jgi:hypothetical protein
MAAFLPRLDKKHLTCQKLFFGSSRELIKVTEKKAEDDQHQATNQVQQRLESFQNLAR